MKLVHLDELKKMKKNKPTLPLTLPKRPKKVKYKSGSASSRHICKICSRRFSSRVFFNNHMKRHKEASSLTEEFNEKAHVSECEIPDLEDDDDDVLEGLMPKNDKPTNGKLFHNFFPNSLMIFQG